MTSDANLIDDYIEALPNDRKIAMTKLRQVIKMNLPEGFSEVMQYGMIGYVVPHALYPQGYHCNPVDPLPFMGLASQKNYVSFYHMGINADLSLLEWFVLEYTKSVSTKLDMGKSCIRFKKMDQIPYELIGNLCKRIRVDQWIKLYEKDLSK